MEMILPTSINPPLAARGETPTQSPTRHVFLLTADLPLVKYPIPNRRTTHYRRHLPSPCFPQGLIVIPVDPP